MNRDLLQKIHELKKEIDSKRPLTESELLELRKWYDVTYTYNSNAIEGNTLTLAETKVVMESGITIGGKQIKEILEVKNHKRVLDILFEVVKDKKDLSEDLILFFHKNLLFDIDEKNAGRYRKIRVYISGSKDVLPAAEKVSGLMKEFFEWHKENKEKIDPLLLSSLIHFKFVKIHPFIDGNGRMARFLQNLILLKAEYIPIVFPVVRRLEYITSIQQEEEKFVEFCLETIHENLKDYLRMI